MNLYLNLEIKNYGAVTPHDHRIKITVDSIDEVGDKITEYFMGKHFNSELVSYKIIARLDTNHDTIPKESYGKKPMALKGRTEIYNH